MTEPLDDVWAARDYPVLREVTRHIDAGDVHVHQNVIAEALGIEPQEVGRAATALERRGLVTLTHDTGPVRFVEVSGSAYLITGLHPDADDALSRLVQVLQQAATQTSDQDERTRLRRAADALLDVSRDVMTGVLTAYLSSLVPH
jgi:DNA-binding IclR family transcriptional regulator